MHPTWEVFLTRYRPMARAIAQSLAASDLDPDDVVQEATLALLAAARAEPERFAESTHARNYLLRTVRNLAYRSHRDAGRSVSLEDEPAAPGPELDRSELRERQRRLAELVRGLTAKERELVARRFGRRETLARISSDSGVPISTLHSRERALLAKLRRRLEARGGIDG